MGKIIVISTHLGNVNELFQEDPKPDSKTDFTKKEEQAKDMGDSFVCKEEQKELEKQAQKEAKIKK